MIFRSWEHFFKLTTFMLNRWVSCIGILECLFALGWENTADWRGGLRSLSEICWVFIRKGCDLKLAPAASLPQKWQLKLEACAPSTGQGWNLAFIWWYISPASLGVMHQRWLGLCIGLKGSWVEGHPLPPFQGAMGSKRTRSQVQKAKYEFP